MTPMTRPASESDVEQAKAAAMRVEDWAGADHFEDCPALKHADGECDCPEDGCPDPDEGCDCYLGAMRACQESILSLLSSHERLTREVAELRKRNERRVSIFEECPSCTLAPLAKLRVRVEHLEKLIVELVPPPAPERAREIMRALITEARAIREAKPE
jgi:hypothetical protein